jgi:hypothetical protein
VKGRAEHHSNHRFVVPGKGFHHRRCGNTVHVLVVARDALSAMPHLAVAVVPLPQAVQDHDLVLGHHSFSQTIPRQLTDPCKNRGLSLSRLKRCR